MTTTTAAPGILTPREIVTKATKRALGGGTAGALAMVSQVGALMWMRTCINYQYRNGGTFTGTLKLLYREGGVARFYRGVGPALLQGPLARAGDTAANAGALALAEEFDATRNLPMAVKTLMASAAAASFRIFLTPIDTVKTTMQVEGAKAIPALRNKIKIGGPSVLYHGALAASAATLVGHYPWFFVFNTLNEKLPKQTELMPKLVRNAFIGLCASMVSDTISNSVRVTKVYKQSHTSVVSYPVAVKEIVAKDGISGLMFRGLKTKILANGLQSMLFSVVWRATEDYLRKKPVTLPQTQTSKY